MVLKRGVPEVWMLGEDGLKLVCVGEMLDVLRVEGTSEMVTSGPMLPVDGEVKAVGVALGEDRTEDVCVCMVEEVGDEELVVVCMLSLE